MKIRSLIFASILALSPVLAYGQTANGKATTSAPTYPNNQAAPLSLDTSGGLRVNCVSGCSGSGNSNAQATSVAPSYSNNTSNPISQDLSGNLRTTLATSIPAGTNTIGSVYPSISSLTRADTLPNNSSGWSNLGSPTYLNNFPYYFNGTTWDRQRGDVNGSWVVPSGSSSGTSNFSAILAASTNSTLVKNAAGIITEISVYNSGSTIAWLKLYNASSAPTCGSGTPVGRYMIPGASSGGAGSNVSIDLGKAFSTGIAFCVTTGIADSDTTAVAASTYTVNMTYK